MDGNYEALKNLARMGRTEMPQNVVALCGKFEISKTNRGSLPISVNTYRPIIGSLPLKGKESQRR